MDSMYQGPEQLVMAVLLSNDDRRVDEKDLLGRVSITKPTMRRALGRLKKDQLVDDTTGANKVVCWHIVDEKEFCQVVAFRARHACGHAPHEQVQRILEQAAAFHCE